MKSESQPEHGTESTYVNWMCRCERCRAAHAEAAQKRREAKGKKMKREAGK